MTSVLFKLEILDCVTWKLQLCEGAAWLSMNGLTMLFELQNKFQDFDSVLWMKRYFQWYFVSVQFHNKLVGACWY